MSNSRASRKAGINVTTFVIPLSSCSPCVKEALDNILEYRNDLFIFFLIGESEDPEILKRVTALESSFTGLYHDPEYRMSRYESNIGSPAFIRLKAGKLTHKTNLAYEDFFKLAEKFSF